MNASGGCCVIEFWAVNHVMVVSWVEEHHCSNNRVKHLDSKRSERLHEQRITSNQNKETSLLSFLSHIGLVRHLLLLCFDFIDSGYLSLRQDAISTATAHKDKVTSVGVRA